VRREDDCRGENPGGERHGECPSRDMNADGSCSALSTLRAAARPRLDWPKLYRFAVAAGCCESVPVDEEGVAAVDELLSRSLPGLVMLGELAATASARPLAHSCRRELQLTTAGVVRLLDRALTAYGRDHHQDVDDWRQGVVITAAATAAFLDRDPEPVRGQLSGTLERGARCIAHALVALPREPSTVPDHLGEAAPEFLVGFAATTE
jgi:hypothetical protein